MCRCVIWRVLRRKRAKKTRPQERVMNRCVICRFPTLLDDAIAPINTSICICLRCYERETGAPHVMPRRLRRELEEALEPCPAEASR
jgi:hypothetical protein